MKNKFLNELKEILNDKFVKKEDIKQVLEDYEELFNEANNEGISDKDFIEKIGTPKDIYNSLKNDLNYEITYSNKIIGVSVFIAIIAFMLTGFLLNIWAYNWMIFLLIPITATITNNNKKEMIPGLSVFLSIILFYTFGRLFSLWHPLWLIFLSIPITSILVNSKKENVLLQVSPFVALIIYITLTYFDSSLYIYLWPIFLITPIIGAFIIKNKFRKYMTVFLIILSIILYYLLSFIFNTFSYTLLVFIIPILYAIIIKEIEINVDIKILNNKLLLITIFTVIALFLLTGLLIPNAWTYNWLLILIIPVAIIYNESKFENLVHYTPFISITLFYLFGMLINNGFRLSWLFFFLIPITAILTEKDEVNKD